MTRIAYALDATGTTRSYDRDGHLHVSNAVLSKAAVSQYWGSEIPDHQALGLDPQRTYNLFRDPEELRAGADSFAGKPILLVHQGSTAEDHPRGLTVGSVGSPATFDGEALLAPLHVWDAEAIGGIANNTKKCLSGGYRYRADMTPGQWRGQQYDGVMRDIAANHVALVKDGRVDGAVVGDSALDPSGGVGVGISPDIIRRSRMATVASVSRTALLASGAVRALLATRLAADAKIDLAPILRDVSARSWAADKSRIVRQINDATRGKLAQDADLDDLPAALSSIDEPAAVEASEPPPAAPAGPGGPPGAPPAATPPSAAPAPPFAKKGPAEDDGGPDMDKITEMLAGKLDPETMAALMAVLGAGEAPAPAAEDEPPPGAAYPPKKEAMPPMVTKHAMDAAIDKARRETRDGTIKLLHEISAAREAVRPVVGTLAGDARDPAAIYRMALDAMSVDLAGVPEAGFASVFRAVAAQRAEASRAAPGAAFRPSGMAADEKATSDFETTYGRAPRVM